MKEENKVLSIREWKQTKEYKEKHAKVKEKAKKVCPICNKEFTPTTEFKKYCSVECREAGDREREKGYTKTEEYKRKRKERYLAQREASIKTKVCPICNKKFKTTNGNAIYCSEACKVLGRKIKQRIYKQTEAGKETQRKYRQSEAYKEVRKKYVGSDKWKATIKRYQQSEKGKEARDRYVNSEKGQEAVKRAYQNQLEKRKQERQKKKEENTLQN